MGKVVVIIMLGLLLCVSAFLLVRAYSSIEQQSDALAQTQTDLAQTQTELQQTRTELAQVKRENALLTKTTELQQTRTELAQVKRENALLTKTAEQNKFLFYYNGMVEQQYGVSNLESCLKWEWKESAYKPASFDCSEMSAFLEWMLENEGFHTVIVAGKSPDGSSEKHAWLLVETSPREYMPVEATAFSIVYWDSPYFDNYFQYDRQFETIQEALTYSPTEFDWWELK
jgi:hypothetical protein